MVFYFKIFRSTRGLDEKIDWDYHQNILKIDKVPHDWLFKKLDGLIHHGIKI